MIHKHTTIFIAVMAFFFGLFVASLYQVQPTSLPPFPITISPDAPRSAPNEIPVFKSCAIQWNVHSTYSLHCEVK